MHRNFRAPVALHRNVMTNIFTRNKSRRSGNPCADRLPHLRCFALPPHDPTPEEQETTICGDILHAAHAEAQRLSSLQPASRLEPMLGVISYCYTKGLFSSMEIEHELWQIPAFLAAFGNDLPTAQQIRNFRRRNRPLIISVIEQALDEFSKREPCSVRQQVVAVEPSLDGPAQAMALWLLNMASYSDAVDAD